MEAESRQKSLSPRVLIFVCGALCIAAAGLTAHFFELRNEEKEKRVAAEKRIEDLTSELQLLTEKNRELAEELREAKEIADQLAREREEVLLASARAPVVTPEPQPTIQPRETEVKPQSLSAGVAVANGTTETTTRPLVEPGGQQPQKEGEALPIVAEAEAGTEKTARAAGGFGLKRIAAGVGRITGAAGDGLRGLQMTIASSTRLRQPDRDLASVKGEPPPEAKSPEALAPPTQPSVAPTETPQKSEASTAMEMPTIPAPSSASASATPQAESSPASAAPKKLTATSEELQKELEEVRREKRELEKEIAERTGSLPGSVDVGQVKITTGRRFSGKVLVVNPKHNFVVIDIGREKGLEKGVVLIVHRGNKFVGKAQVIKAYEKMAAADLVADWMQDEVQVNDGVKKF